MKRKQPAPCPNIDLLCKYQVIVTTNGQPRWKTIGQGVRSAARAREAGLRAGFKQVWLNDGFGRTPCF